MDGVGILRRGATPETPRLAGRQTSLRDETEALFHDPDRVPKGLAWSKTWRSFVAALWLLLTLFAPLSRLHAQPAATHRVLDLDGTNACVVLPSGLATNDVATIEGWFKWRRFNSMSRLFDFYGERLPFGIMNRGTTANLHFERPERNAAGVINQFVHVAATGLLATNEWCHVAAVVRTNSTRLFFNGVLVATEEVPFNWTPPIEPDRTNYLGRSVMSDQRRSGGNPDFDGQMTEIRLWNGERTVEQLRETMFKNLTGTEAGLAGLWNFANVENGVVKDATPGAHHGQLIGNAKTVEAPRPGSVAATVLGNVLELDGTNSFVQLPPNIFSTLTESTVEGWVKWSSFGSYSRFFDFGKHGQLMGVYNLQTSRGLSFEISHDGFAELSRIDVPEMLQPNEWVHVAAASGPAGMRLYLNGQLIGTHPSTNSFAAIGNGRNYLGYPNTHDWPGGNHNDAPFRGQMTEVRVWRVARTEVQIRETMFKDLTGAEPNLAGLWNFRDGTAKDFSTNAHHGMFNGGARVVQAPRPAASQLKLPALLFGKTTDSRGNAPTNATIRLWRGDERIATTESRPDGTYSLVLRSEQAEGAFDIQTEAGDLGAWVLGVVCSAGERKEVNVPLASAARIEGKVTAFDGSAIEGVVVQVVRADAQPRAAGALTTPGLAATTLTTNSVPSYRFLNLRPGEYKVRIHHPEGQIEYRGGEVLRVEPGQTLNADFPIAPFRKGRWRRYTTANGLPSSEVHDLHFAPDGTLWLATRNGVSRFDGLKFSNLSAREGLIDTSVFCIHAEPEGALWFGTEKGASRFEP